MSSSLNQSDFHRFPIYKLFFDDIEEIFLHYNSLRFLLILLLWTFVISSLLLLLLCCRSRKVFSMCLLPFLYALIFYDFIQLFALVLLKANFIGKSFNHFCRWSYYLKSLSEAGQCLTLVFLFALIRHQLRYYHTHHRLPNTDRIHSRALTFVCLLFIIYIHNWITHLKVEKIHSITFHRNDFDMEIDELPISFYETSQTPVVSYQRFIVDLENYSQGYEKQSFHQQTDQTNRIVHHHQDGSVVIKFPYENLYSSLHNRTKRQLMTEKNKLNQSYRIARCTYGQTNFSLANILALIHSIVYLLLIVYYITTICTYRIPLKTIEFHQFSYERSLTNGRRKSAEYHRQLMILIHLKRFFRLILCCHTLFACLRLIYTALLTIFLAFLSTPFQWFPVKQTFYILFLFSYYSVPIRMTFLFIYFFWNQFSSHFQSIFFYLCHRKLRFAWKFERPQVFFRWQLIPPQHQKHQDLMKKFSAVTTDDDPSTVCPQESATIYEENSRQITLTLTRQSFVTRV